MSLISFTPIQDGVTGVNGAATNTPLSTIYNDYNGNITNANIASNAAIDGSKLSFLSFPKGLAVQQVSSVTTAVATGTITIPADDTIPQNTEGDQYMSLAITPRATTNTLVIQSLIQFSHSTASGNMVAALFQDSTANALAVNWVVNATGSGPLTVLVTHTMAAGTTSATTFKIRAGNASTAGTTTFNGSGGSRFFGAISKSSMVITEYNA